MGECLRGNRGLMHGWHLSHLSCCLAIIYYLTIRQYYLVLIISTLN